MRTASLACSLVFCKRLHAVALHMWMTTVKFASSRNPMQHLAPDGMISLSMPAIIYQHQGRLAIFQACCYGVLAKERHIHGSSSPKTSVVFHVVCTNTKMD